MKKWEYTWVAAGRSELEKYMNLLGQEGWEAYAVTADITNGNVYNYTAFLKREVVPEESEKE